MFFNIHDIGEVMEEQQKNENNQQPQPRPSTVLKHILPEALRDIETRQMIDQALQDSRAKIPASLEDYYFSYHNHHQRHHLLQINFLAQLAFMLYFFADYIILQDVTLLSGILRSITVITAMYSSFYLFKHVTDIRILELILPVNSLIFVCVWFFILRQSQSPYIGNYLYASFIFLILANLAAQVRFRPILYVSLLISAAIFIGLSKLVSPMESLIYLLTFIPIFVFSLFISWNTILNARRSFLRILLDDWTYHNLQHLAHTDELTQLSNRREFLNRAEQEVNQWPKCASTSLFMFDVDHFKNINDQYGHDVGDMVLKRIAEISRKEMRHKDILARFGGEEFIVLLADSSLEETLLIAERVRQRIATHPVILNNGEELHFTVSVGVASLHPTEEDLQTLIKQADIALYSAKASGRNRVVTYEASMPERGTKMHKKITSWVV